MFSQEIQKAVSNAVTDLDYFRPASTIDYSRDELIEMHWQFHPRYRSFKVYPRKNGAVLDIGSGSGGLFFWKNYLRPKRNDLAMTALDLSKGEFFDKYQSYSIFNLDDGNLPFPEASFDYIIQSHLIEHVKDWKSLLTKCNKVLKNNGIIYIETPSKHTINLASRDYYVAKGYPCTTINFMDDKTHVLPVDLDEVNKYASQLNMMALEKGFCKNPYLEDVLISYGFKHKDIEVSQYGLWSKLMFSSYIILQKI